jgi:hypothetical protein
VTDEALAPVAFFAYKRPRHAAETLSALARNDLAEKTTLYAFCDGPAEGASTSELEAIEEVRRGIRQLWPGRVVMRLRDRNLGLSRSIISGITEVFQSHDQVIAVEDDLVTSPVFLRYMNAGLSTFRDDPRVGSINAYAPPIPGLPDWWFMRGGDCWGWATWVRAWSLFEPDTRTLLEKLEAQPKNRRGYSRTWKAILRASMEGRVDSWHIRWHTSLWLRSMLGLFPGKSLIHNIGLDRSGRHEVAADLAAAPETTPPGVFVPEELAALVVQESRRAAMKVTLYETSRSHLTRPGVYLLRALAKLL